jgi:hypothetical protein
VGDRDVHLDDVRTDDDHVIVTFHWSDAEGERLEWGQALRLRDGLIVDMEDYSPPGEAGRRVARLLARLPG